MVFDKLAGLHAVRTLVAVATLLAPLSVVRAQTGDRGAVSPAFLTSQSVVAISLRPKQILANPAAQLFPVEIAQAAGEKYLGMETAHIE